MKKLQTLHLLLLMILSQATFAQKLSDTMFNKMSRTEMGDYYMKKSHSLKGGGYALMGVGAAATMAASAMIMDDMWEGDVSSGAVTLGYVGFIAFAASYPVLSYGSKNKGRAEMLYMDPDPVKAAQLEKKYESKARTNSIIAWSLLGTGIILPMVLVSGDEYNSKNERIASVARLGTIACLPFFMSAAKNKGRVAVLAHTEKIANSYLPGSSTHRNLGLGFPIAK